MFEDLIQLSFSILTGFYVWVISRTFQTLYIQFTRDLPTNNTSNRIFFQVILFIELLSNEKESKNRMKSIAVLISYEYHLFCC